MSAQPTLYTSNAEQIGLGSPDFSVQLKALSRLHELAMRLAATPEPQPALQAILETLVEAHAAEHGLLWLYDPHRCKKKSSRAGLGHRK